jgi:N-acyl-phosphatidylethanolamine-hydrolysing phospholipase D
MTRRSINRRGFLNQAFSWIKWVIFGSAFAHLFRNNMGFASSSMDPRFLETKQLSLREMAEKKTHHGDGRFLNPFTQVRHGNLWRLIKWKVFSKNEFKAHYSGDHTKPVRIDWKPIVEHKDCSITFLRHASVMIKDRESTMLVDPLFDGLFWLTDYSPLGFDIDEMPSPDHVLITHGHLDHLDVPSISKLNKETHVITPLGYNSIFKDLGMPSRTQLDWFDSYREGRREIMLLPCNHWTMRNPFVGPNDSLWGSFLIRTDSGITIFVSGDLAYFDRFGELGEEFSIDLAIFNLGAYEPRWFMAGSHLNPQEAAKSFRALKAKHLMVVHWGTFRLGDEPVHFPPLDIKSEMEAQGMLDRLIHLDHGQTLFYDGLKNIRIA